MVMARAAARGPGRLAPLWTGWLRGFVLALLLAFTLAFIPPAVAAPAAGSVIESRAELSYVDASSGLAARMLSNTVRVQVLPVAALVLGPEQSARHPPGGLFGFAHRLVNTGNSALDVKVTTAGDPSLRIVRDDNGNGRADDGEAVLGLDDRLPLAAGAAADLLLLGRVPAGAEAGDALHLQLRAVTDDADGPEAINDDDVLVSAGPALRLWKTLQQRSAAPGSRLDFGIVATNTGAAAARGLPLQVDGDERRLVLITDTLPANTRLIEAVGAVPLYHRRGEPARHYSTQAPADLAEVDQVAWGFDELAAGQTVAVQLALRVHAGAAGTIANRADVRFNGLDGPLEQVSNTTSMALPQRPPVLAFFDDAAFTRPAIAGTRGQALYLRADAAACNRDATRIEQVGITLRAMRSGDRETFVAAETTANSGVFRITPGVPTGDGSALADDGRLALQADDEVIASLAGCGTALTEAVLPIEPHGVAYDSKTNQPLAGVRITLVDAGGAAVARAATDALGRYAIPPVAPGRHRLRVEPADDHVFPSQLAPALQPGGRRVDALASYGEPFDVVASGVHVDLPLDPSLATGLRLRKQASRERVERGDFVDYTVELVNVSSAALAGVLLRDRLPPGFAYVPGSTRRDGRPAPDPARGDGTLVYAVGSLASQAGTTLVYRLRVTPTAAEGSAVNRAQAASAAPLQAGSNVASASVWVGGGVLGDRATLLGRVAVDCNRNGRPDGDEPGAAGVRLWLETGASALTDAQGRYHFDGLAPLTHVVRLDPLTLPQPLPASADGRFVAFQNGELRRADFVLPPNASCVAVVALTRHTSASPIAPASLPSASASASASQPQPQSASTLPSLPSLLHGLAAEPAILWPRDGAVLAQRQTPVRIAGPNHGRWRLSVDGRELPASRIGTRSEDAARGVLALEYIGVDLRPGRNRLLLQWFDESGSAHAPQAITLVAPGAPARIEIDAPEPALAGQALALRLRLLDAAGTPVAERTAVTLQASAGAWQADDLDPAAPGLQTFIEGGATSWLLQAPERPGPLRLQAAAGTLQAERRITLAAPLRPLFASGIVEGVFDLSRLRGMEPAGPGDAFERELRGRAALFLKGKVRGDTLLTLAYDSAKPPAEIEPERYYPVYGDDATRSDDVASASRLFVRVDRGTSFALYGDFQTAPQRADGGPALARYSRSLTGVQMHNETNTLTSDLWASQSRSRRVVDEFAANGTSGPFRLRTGAVVAGSERVEVLVRDREQPANVLRSMPQTPFVDYDLEPDSGRLLLRGPLASVDAALNPVSLRISYESERGGPDAWVWGGDVELQAADGLRLGASLAQDEAEHYRLAGVRAAWQAGPSTALRAELAGSRGDDGSGHAGRVEIEHQGAGWDAKLGAGRSGSGFDNPGAPLGRGREEIKAEAGRVIDERTRLRAEALRSADLANGGARSGLRAVVERDLGDGVRVEGGVRVAHETAAPAEPGSAGNTDFTSLRARIAAPLPGRPALSLYGEAEQAVIGDGAMRAVGGEMALAAGGRVYARHEFINSFSGGYGLNPDQRRTTSVFGFDRDDGQGLRVFSEYRGRDAADDARAEAAIGLRKLWTPAPGWRVGGGFERVEGVDGTSRDEALAVSSQVQWSGQPGLKVNTRVEWRDAPLQQSWLATGGLAWKLDERWRVLAKASLDLAQPEDGSTGLRRERLQGGLAWRDPAGPWLLLARYGWQRDDAPERRRSAHIVSLHGNYQADAENEWTLRYAAKHGREDSAGLASRGSAELVSARWLHRIDERWDIGIGARLLADSAAAAPAAGLIGEVGFRVGAGLWLSVGMSALALRDADLAAGEPVRRGAFLRLRFKFDETTFSGLGDE